MTMRKKPARRRCIGMLFLLAGFAFGTPAAVGQDAGDPNAIGWNVEDRFAFVWDSVEVSTQVFNPSYTGQRDLYECGRSITVVGKVHVLDANDLVGMQVVDPDILQVVDSDGNSVAWTPLPWDPLRQYQELKYEYPMSRDTFGMPQAVLQPYDVLISFCVDPNQKAIRALSLFEWCAYAVYAEDVIEVDVPFEASDDWVKAAPGLQIRVTKATIECCDYTYWTEVKHPGGTVRAFDDPSSPAEPIADYLVVRTLLLDADGNPIRATEDNRVSSAVWSECVENTLLNTVKCGGWLLTFAAETEIASIRHVIVVHPYEVRVPFAVRDLPVPAMWRK